MHLRKYKAFIGRQWKGILLVFWMAGFARAQQSLVLTLDESLAIALDKSFRIQTLRQSMITAERNLWAARAGYRTSITTTFSAPIYDEGFKLIDVVEGNPVAKQFGSYQVSGQLDLKQPMPWIPFGGADMTFRSQAYRLNSWTPNRLDPNVQDKSTKFFTYLGLIVNKPLFTINDLALGLERAKLAYERQSRVFKRQELDLVYSVTDAFYRLYRFTQTVDINRQKVSMQQDIYNTTFNKFKAGLIAEVDAMQAEVALLQYRNDLKNSETMLAEQESMFKQTIGIPEETRVRVITELELKQVNVPLDKAQLMAMQNRSELVEKQISIEEQKIIIKQVDARVAIEGKLSGYYNFSGFSDPTFVYGTDSEALFRSSWEKLQKTPNRGFTFSLQVPLFDWGRNRAEVDAQKAILKSTELDLSDTKVTVIREAEDAVRSVANAWDRVQMLTKSQEVATKSLDINLKRFANGDITSTDLARATDQTNQAKINYLQAYVDYKLSLGELKRKTLYDFEKDIPLVEKQTSDVKFK